MVDFLVKIPAKFNIGNRVWQTIHIFIKFHSKSATKKWVLQVLVKIAKFDFCWTQGRIQWLVVMLADEKVIESWKHARCFAGCGLPRVHGRLAKPNFTSMKSHRGSAWNEAVSTRFRSTLERMRWPIHVWYAISGINVMLRDLKLSHRSFISANISRSITSD